MDRRLFSLSALGLATAACSPIKALNAIAPDETYRATTGIAYGDGPRRMLDVYVPSGGPGPHPVAVFVYGGSWTSGKREDYLFAAEGLARRGYVAVLPDYRLDPEGRFPGFVEDTAAAVAWTVRNAARFQGDPRRVFMMGHSAGAYNVMMVAADGRYLAAHGIDRKAIAGVAGLAGPYDFLPLQSTFMRRIFGHVADPETTQPVKLADAHMPPALLLHGTKDGTVYPRNTTAMADRLRQLGVKVEAKLYPDVGHAELVVGMSALSRDNPPVLTDFDRFTRTLVAQG